MNCGGCVPLRIAPMVVAATPAGRKVLADPPMQKLAMLCNESAARKLEWDIRRQMVVGTPELEAAARKADEVWFFRSKIWNWVLADLRAHAAKRLEEARALSGVLTPQVFPAYLPASLTGLYLSRLARLGTGALTEIAEIAQWRRQWTLYRKARSQTL